MLIIVFFWKRARLLADLAFRVTGMLTAGHDMAEVASMATVLNNCYRYGLNCNVKKRVVNVGLFLH